MADVDRFLANNENDVSGAGVTNVSFQTGAADQSMIQLNHGLYHAVGGN